MRSVRSSQLQLQPQRNFRFDLDESLEPQIAVRAPFGVGEADCLGPMLSQCSEAPNGSLVPDGHEEFMMHALSHFVGYRVIWLCGSPGMGGRGFAGRFAGFASFPGGRFFSGGAVVIDSSQSHF